MGDESSDEYTFEFVQDGEFEDPRYVIRDGMFPMGELIFREGYWYAKFDPHSAHSEVALGWVAEKISELDVGTYNQRIFKLF